MAHSSNIPISSELGKEFSVARTSGTTTRFIRADIDLEAEIINSSGSAPTGASEEADWTAMQSKMELKKPTFFVFRLDEKFGDEALGYKWVLVCYVPDGSPVKSRMLYASTRDYMRKQLGASYIYDEMYGTSPDEFTYAAWLEFKDRKKVILSAMTVEETALADELAGPVAVGPSTEGVHGVVFPVMDDATAALKAFADGSVNLVQLKLNLSDEKVELRDSKNVDIDGLVASVPEKEPCYSFFNWKHEHEGESITSCVFIYSCPTGSKVKARMLYSSVKSTAAAACAGAGTKIDKKMEITDPKEEITLADLQFLVHPPAKKAKAKFSRPSRPGKGGRRLVRRSK